MVKLLRAMWDGLANGDERVKHKKGERLWRFRGHFLVALLSAPFPPELFSNRSENSPAEWFAKVVVQWRI